jgi:flagellar basal-body rod modification protein FlgD
MSTTASITAANSNPYLNSVNNDSRLPMKTMGQQDFLKLLVTQFSSQDPMNPTKDTDFISQMAQFSALENSVALQNEVTALRQEQEFLQAPDLLGRMVELKPDAKTTVIGTVSAIRMENGIPKMEVNGKLYHLGTLNSVLMPN